MSDTPASSPRGMLARLSAGLSRSAQTLTGVFNKTQLDAGNIALLEEGLIRTDVGTALSHRIAMAVGEGRYDREISTYELRQVLTAEIGKILASSAMPFRIDPAVKPFVVLVAGVNGTGKTTTIGKLAARLKAEGRTVVIAAGDTFRAAATEQLKVWGERAGATVIASTPGGDAAGLAYEAVASAKASGADVVLIDTAGRLQNKAGLMAELEKIARVLKKLDASAPHAAILVLDATTGQNALSQVEAFRAAVPLTGLIMTKLDGTAKGGILVALADRFGLPIHFIGVGEGVEDLQPFDANAFAAALTARA